MVKLMQYKMGEGCLGDSGNDVGPGQFGRHNISHSAGSVQSIGFKYVTVP
jgi:hypothetical protein